VLVCELLPVLLNVGGKGLGTWARTARLHENPASTTSSPTRLFGDHQR
jgi:hypothetical protein